MKTAMQELIHDFNHGKFSKLTINAVEKELQKYLSKERQQIEDAYASGEETVRCTCDGGYLSSEQLSSDYYNKTYNQ